MKTDQRDGGDRGSRGYSRCNVRKYDSESMKRCWMAMGSKIEWTDATWNPVRGCTKISPGCKHCYAETFAERFRGVKGHPYEQGFDLRLVPFFLHRSRPRPTLAAYDHPIHPPQIYLTSVQTAQ